MIACFSMVVDPEKRTWANVRVLLGFAQVVAATTTAILLFQTGVNWPTATGGLLTMVLLLTSRLLFHSLPGE